MAARVRWRGSTTARGYGSPHQGERRRRAVRYRPGDICAIGGERMFLPVAYLDLAHDHVNGGYLPGLACRRHNRGEGASRGNRMRAPAYGWATSRRW
jgi:hypothetical protein